MAENNVINGREVTGMIEHWLQTPVNGYLGSSYGSDFESLVQLPQSSINADSIFDKLVEDIEILKVLPNDAVGLFAEDVGSDGKRVYIQTFDSRINLDEVERRS